MTCPICRCEGPHFPAYYPREMVLGLDESFEYRECPGCGVVWLVKTPENIAKYYDDYYSFKAAGGSKKNLFVKVMDKLFRHGFYSLRRVVVNQLRNRFIFFYRARARRLLQDSRGVDRFVSSYSHGVSLNSCALFGIGLKDNSKILDFGSGHGEFVQEMRSMGFAKTYGFDPFYKENTDENAPVQRGDLEAAQKRFGPFDVITLHHSFEHMPEPFEIAKKFEQCLAPNGKLIIRIPNVHSLHFKEYKDHWWGFHAPRHYFLYSRKAMELVFEKAGLVIKHVKCDSCLDHYLYSQEYQVGIGDASPHSLRAGGTGIFLPAEYKYWEKKAPLLNKALVGDWIVYYLERK